MHLKIVIYKLKNSKKCKNVQLHYENHLHFSHTHLENLPGFKFAVRYKNPWIISLDTFKMCHLPLVSNICFIHTH